LSSARLCFSSVSLSRRSLATCAAFSASQLACSSSCGWESRFQTHEIQGVDLPCAAPIAHRACFSSCTHTKIVARQPAQCWLTFEGQSRPTFEGQSMTSAVMPDPPGALVGQRRHGHLKINKTRQDHLRLLVRTCCLRKAARWSASAAMERSSCAFRPLTRVRSPRSRATSSFSTSFSASASGAPPTMCMKRGEY